MSWNGSEQLEKAMEEVLDDDDDEVKVEKSNLEKMEKHKEPESRVPETQPAGNDSGLFRSLYSRCVHLQIFASYVSKSINIKLNILPYFVKLIFVTLWDSIIICCCYCVCVLVSLTTLHHKRKNVYTFLPCKHPCVYVPLAYQKSTFTVSD